MTEQGGNASGVVGGGDLGEGDLELSAVDQVSAADAARRARERVELVDLLSLFAGRAPDLCCNGLDVEPGAGQTGSCGCDRPGAEERFGHGAGQGADAQSDGLDGCVCVGDGALDRCHDGGQQPEFMHPLMMPGFVLSGDAGLSLLRATVEDDTASTFPVTSADADLRATSGRDAEAER